MGEKSAHEAASPIEEQESPIEEQKQKLAALLAHRDDVKRLQDLNILPTSTLAPALQSAQRELESKQKADFLNKELGNRATPDALVNRGILDKDEAPSST